MCSQQLFVSAGIWSRDIRFKSNLPLTEINKILKNLESKKLIKAVKSVAVSFYDQSRVSSVLSVLRFIVRSEIRFFNT